MKINIPEGSVNDFFLSSSHFTHTRFYHLNHFCSEESRNARSEMRRNEQKQTIWTKKKPVVFYTDIKSNLLFYDYPIIVIDSKLSTRCN